MPQAESIDDHEHEDDNDVVPCRPMAVFELVVVGDCRLRVVVSCLKSYAIVAITPRVTQREIGDGRVAVCTHIHRHRESNRPFGRYDDGSKRSQWRGSERDQV